MNNLEIRGNHDEDTLLQMALVMEDAEYGVLCADGHLGYSFPIGGVAAYKDKISPNGVGYDIGCGNCAYKLHVKYEDIKESMPEIMDYIWETFPFGTGGKATTRIDHVIFDKPEWDDLTDIPCPSGYFNMKDLAVAQFGSIGSGNHYVDIFKDTQDYVWIGVHFGSRRFGHTVASWFFNQLGAKDDMYARAVSLDINSDLGQKYIKAMKLAGEYAEAARAYVCQKVANKIASISDVVDKVHNHHNFAWLETHFGEEYWVVRKGSTPLYPGQKGFVGSNMWDNSYILEGLEYPSTAASKLLYSTIHGAGRAMGRNKAKKSYNWEDTLKEVKRRGIELRGGAVDESPACYKPIQEVLNSHSDTFNILETLTPVGVAMSKPDRKR